MRLRVAVFWVALGAGGAAPAWCAPVEPADEGGNEGRVEGDVVGERTGEVGASPAPPPEASAHTDEPVTVRVSALAPIDRPSPEYPPDQKGLHADPVTCEVQVLVGNDGAVTGVTQFACPDPFWAATEAALRRWRFEPYRVDGERREVQFRATVKYVDA